MKTGLQGGDCRVAMTELLLLAQDASAPHCMSTAIQEQRQRSGDGFLGSTRTSSSSPASRFLLVNRISQNATNVATRLVSRRDTSYCDKYRGRDSGLPLENL